MASRELVYERALNTLRQWLKDKVVDADDSFPSEEALAARLRISRGTVRKVLRVLEGEALIHVERTRGRRVRGEGEVSAGRASKAIVVLGTSWRSQFDSEELEGSVEDSCVHTFRAQGQPVLLIDAQHAAPEQALRVLGHKPLGVVLTQFVAEIPRWHALMAEWRSAGVPVVAHGNEPALAAFDRVCSDHRMGAYELTKRLIAQGRRRIVQVWTLPEAWFVESKTFSAGRPQWLIERERGYREAMTEVGLPVLPAVNVPNMPERSGIPDLANLETRARCCLGFLFQVLKDKNPADAILAINDAAVFPVALACQMLERRVPEQTAVAGFDATWHTYWEWGATGLQPHLTVKKHNYAVGQAMAELLLERIAGAKRADPILRCLPVDIEAPAQREDLTKKRSTVQGAIV